MNMLKVKVPLDHPEYGSRLRQVFRVIAGQDFFEKELKSLGTFAIGVEKVEFGVNIVAVLGVGAANSIGYSIENNTIYSEAWIVPVRANHVNEEDFNRSIGDPALEIFEKCQKVRDKFEKFLVYSNI